MRLFFQYLFSPQKVFLLANRLTPWLICLFIPTFIYGLGGGLFSAPPDVQQGEGFRIIYVHVPAAFLSLAIYFCMALASVLVLVFRLTIPFLVIKHSARIGFMFTAISLITGSIWGKPMWGTWWIWDARLTSQLILLFLYAAILLFQAALAGKKQHAPVIAILVLAGFIDIPIIHYSVYWWNTLHQGETLRLFAASRIAPAMLHPLLAMIAAFILYYAIVLSYALRGELLHLKCRKN